MRWSYIYERNKISELVRQSSKPANSIHSEYAENEENKSVTSNLSIPQSVRTFFFCSMNHNFSSSSMSMWRMIGKSLKNSIYARARNSSRLALVLAARKPGTKVWMTTISSEVKVCQVVSTIYDGKALVAVAYWG